MRIERRHTTQGETPYAKIDFRLTTSEIKNPDGSVVFRLDNVEVRPVAYFAHTLGREASDAQPSAHLRAYRADPVEAAEHRALAAQGCEATEAAGLNAAVGMVNEVIAPPRVEVLSESRL